MTAVRTVKDNCLTLWKQMMEVMVLDEAFSDDSRERQLVLESLGTRTRKGLTPGTSKGNRNTRLTSCTVSVNGKYTNP